MQSFAKLGLSIFVLTLLVSTVLAQGPATGTVKGSVKKSNNPVSGVRVVIDSTAVSSYEAVATTDQEGAFTFTDAPVGEVEVRVYDANENLLVTGKGTLKQPSEVITLLLEVAP